MRSRRQADPTVTGRYFRDVDASGVVGARIGDKSRPVLLSTIRLRKAGFAVCRDSVESLLHRVGRMVDPAATTTSHRR